MYVHSISFYVMLKFIIVQYFIYLLLLYIIIIPNVQSSHRCTKHSLGIQNLKNLINCYRLITFLKLPVYNKIQVQLAPWAPNRVDLSPFF